MPSAPSPAPSGTAPQRSVNQVRPASSVVRPGRKPGVRPASSAPCTLARRSAERNRTSWTCASSAAAPTIASAPAARLPRPTITTTGPVRPSETRVMSACTDAATGSPGTVRRHDRRVCGQCVRRGREVDERHAELDDRAAQPQEEHRHLVAEVAVEHHDGGGTVEVGDLGPLHAEDEVGGQAVAELRVDVIGSDHALREHRPEVCVLVRAARAAQHRDRRRAVQLLRLLDRLPPRGRAHRATTLRGSRHLHESAVRANGARSAPTRGRSDPCRTAIRGSRAPSRRRAGARGDSTTTAPRRGSASSTSCTTSRPSRGPRAGRGTGTGSRSGRRRDRSARCCPRSTSRTAALRSSGPACDRRGR